LDSPYTDPASCKNRDCDNHVKKEALKGSSAFQRRKKHIVLEYETT
jgi:hypothetical protein